VRDTKNKSVEHQHERAIAYIKKKGWTVSDEHVFKDDGISGAEYVNRPGLVQLLACLPKRGKPPFDVLVMSEPSRLGRDITRNAAFVVSIIESGVRIFYYLTDEEEKADTPEQQIFLTLRGYASAVERIKAGQRTRSKLVERAKQGYVTGGRCFGYENVEVPGDNGSRSHVDHKINEQEAEIVRRIFTMYRDGHGKGKQEILWRQETTWAAYRHWLMGIIQHLGRRAEAAEERPRKLHPRAERHAMGKA
jgi:site-specific DNA recombinase